MNVADQIPPEPLDIRSNSRGFLPSIGLHLRGRLYVQESSYWHFGFLGILLVAALVLNVLPWKAEIAAGGLKLKGVIAAGLVWAGICGVVPYWVRNAFGQTIRINPVKRIWTIQRRQSVQVIPWEEILGLQVCRQTVPGQSKLNGYQLNLVWQDSAGRIQRHCLLKHALRRFVYSLGNQYAARFRLELFDMTTPK